MEKSLKTFLQLAEETSINAWSKVKPNTLRTSVTALMQDYDREKIYFGISLFVRLNGTSISNHISIQGYSLEETLTNFRIECEKQCEQYITTVEWSERKDTDLKLD